MLARLRTRRATVLGLLAVATAAALAAAPWVLWHLQPPTPLDVIVVDKSVAGTDDRTHRGVTWVLRHEKVVQRATGRPLAEDDYAGPRAGPDGEPRIVPIPARQADLVYVADAYGVDGDRARGGPSHGAQLVPGGLSSREVQTLLTDLRPGAVLVGEASCIAAPTTDAARAALSAALGIRWTGWVGRHFPYLDLTADLPEWIPRAWTRQTGRGWPFRGPGYVLMSEQGRLVVLVEGVDTPRRALRVRVAADAADRYGTARRQSWDGWFEVMEPRPRAEVLATFELDVTPSGRRKLRGVPVERPFPAILRTARADRVAYYLAGDFADQPHLTRAYRYRWLPKIKALLGVEHRDDGQAFFWRVYAPMMQRIVEEASRSSRSSHEQHR